MTVSVFVQTNAKKKMKFTYKIRLFLRIRTCNTLGAFPLIFYGKKLRRIVHDGCNTHDVCIFCTNFYKAFDSNEFHVKFRKEIFVYFMI